ncbi:MAG: DUF1835 domain-containing protein [Firmicutes bacterium]|nr:DUF1835 domain-containing protein [Bacillota bacterium]
MIEIVFDNLSHNTLKHAQKYGEGNYPGGYAYITYYNDDHTLMTEFEAREALRKAEEEEARCWNEATPLGGDPNDVFDFSLNLNIGDISELNDLEKRISSLDSYQYDQENYSIGEYERTVHEAALESLKTIIDRIKAGETARIWYSKTAQETLGFQWLMWNFKAQNVSAQSIIVKSADSWKSMKVKDWHKHAQANQPFAEELMDGMALEWEHHMKENARLRVMEDGKIRSAATDFYDEIIIKEAKTLKEEFQVSWLMGLVQEKEPELPNYWIYTRIENMILEGKFSLVKEGEEGWPKSWKVIKIAL